MPSRSPKPAYTGGRRTIHPAPATPRERRPARRQIASSVRASPVPPLAPSRLRSHDLPRSPATAPIRPQSSTHPRATATLPQTLLADPGRQPHAAGLATSRSAPMPPRPTGPRALSARPPRRRKQPVLRPPPSATAAVRWSATPAGTRPRPPAKSQTLPTGTGTTTPGSSRSQKLGSIPSRPPSGS